MVLQRSDWSFGFETRTTEVMAVSDFTANIQRFSENANISDRNFTIIVVKTRRQVVLLDTVQLVYHNHQYTF